ncbi:glycosyltransferase family 4 protein [Cytobacillus firmus]|uniref:glycosyltransferase family 4 protein n=1 Tax=Cytobacillus firmus TaxID=1399 RepID=UPI0036A40CED
MINSKMRVLFLVNIPSPYRIDFFNELGKLCELTVLFERKVSDERDKSWYNNNFKNFKSIFLKGIRINKNTALCTGISKYLKRDLYDIFVVGGYSTPTGMLAIEMLRSRKIPFVLNSDGGLIKSDNKYKYILKKHFVSSASYWLSTGRNTTEYLVNYGARRENILNYPFTSISDKDIVSSPVRKNIKSEIKSKLSIKEGKVILSIGQFIERKGFDVLIRASKNLPEDCGVYFIGGEPTQDYLNLKKELNLTNIHFIGFKSKQELKEYYMASDLFVLPTREDIWGLVINEALAHGLPVITTNNCVAGLELVEDYLNGFIVPVNDSYSLSMRMNEVLENEVLIEEMSKNSLDKIQRYTIEKMAQEHIKIFNDILLKH